MDSDFAIVTLPPELREALGAPERILVEAVEMSGAALFRGAYDRWTTVGRRHIVERALTVPREHERVLEELFVAARRQRRHEDETTVIDRADSRNAREHGRGVPHRQNTGGYRRVRRTV